MPGTASAPTLCPCLPRWLPDGFLGLTITGVAQAPCPTWRDNDLNPREAASATWLGVTAIIMVLLFVREPRTGRSFLAVLKALFQPAFVVLQTISIMWILASIVLLAQLDLWRWDNLKTTLVWALTFAPVTIFEYQKAVQGRDFFRRSLVDIAGATVFVQFVVDEYTFPYLAELVVMALLTFLGLLRSVASLNPDTKSLEKPLTVLLSLAGLIYLASAFIQLAGKVSDFAAFSTLREFLVPILLSLAFLPVVYALAVYASYEENFGRLRVFIEDPLLRAYARRKATFAFGLNLKQLNRWSREVVSARPDTEAAVRTTLLTIKRNAAIAQRPTPVFANEGWSPWIARTFLASERLTARDYSDIGDGEWFATGGPLVLTEDLWADTLSYYIEGDARVAHRLKLALNVNRAGEEAASLERLAQAAASLISAATGEIIPAALLVAMLRGQAASAKIGVVQATLGRNDTALKAGRYTLKLTLEPSALLQEAN